MPTKQFATYDAHGRASFRPFSPYALGRAFIEKLCHAGAMTFVAALLMVAAPWNALADAPVLVPSANTTVLEDCGRTNLTFTITDADTPFFAVSVSATSSNTRLVASTNVAAIGSGTTRTVGVTPTPNESGTSTITLVADDGTSRVTNSFVLTVTAVNDGPVLQALTALAINEDAAPTNRTVMLTDVDNPIGFVTLTVRSSDTNLVGVSTTGSATNRTLTLSPVTNANGSATITLIANDGAKTATNTFALTVNAVNDAPALVSLTALSVSEDASPTNRTVTVTDVDHTITNVTVAAISSNTNTATVSIAGTTTNRTLTITPVADAFGTSTITLIASDGAKNTTNSFVFTVTSVNDVPSFTLTTNLVTAAEDSGVFSLSNFVTNITSGPTNESTQTNLFIVTTTNSAFFATQPAISPTGTLSFRGATNVTGTNTISVLIRDSGGTNNAGINSSAAQTISVVIGPVNDAPVISGISAYSIREDVGTTNRTFILNDLDTTISSVSVTATSSDTNLINVSASGTATNRTLAVTTVADANGSATITLVADDGGATATNSFVLTVTPVNDDPGFTLTTNLITVAEDSGAFSLADFATNMISGPSDESSQTNFFVLTVTNTGFYATQPAISPSGTLSFRPNTNVFGTNNISVALRDSGGTNSGGVNTSSSQTFRVVVGSGNDAPVISTIPSFAINEDSRTNRTFSVTDVDNVISNVLVTVSSSDTNLVTAAVSGVTTNKTLALTTLTNANGTATITVTADDGLAVTTNSFTLTVNAVNDGPVLTSLSALSVLEDSAATNRTVILADVDNDITNVTVTATSANTNIATVSITGTDTNRTLTITPVTNAFGTSTITLVADDGTKTATNSFVFTVLSINDIPGFALTTNVVTVAEDSGAFSLTGFAASITSGPSNESTQTNLFLLTVTNTSFFAAQPAISPTGTLTFRPATNTTGTNTISIVMRDSGGTTNSGVNTTAAATFDIVISPVNDSPVMSGLTAFTIKEDLGTTNRTFGLQDIDTDISTITVTATSSDTNVVTVTTSGTTTNRTLSVTSVTNANGSATITLIANDGSNTSTNSLVLTVTAVNDAPSFTLTTNLITVGEDTGSFSVADFATNIVVGPSDESAQTNFFVLTVTNAATFYATPPAVSPTGTLTFTPRTNVFGTNDITIVLRDNGGTNNGGVLSSSAQAFRVVVNATNDAPVISTIANFSINEDVGTTNRAFVVTDVDTTISNVVVIASSSDTNLVNVNVTGSTTNRTLAITTVTNANGAATITLVASDSFVTTTNSFTLTVNAVNDSPVLTPLNALSVVEDSGDTNRTVVVTDVDNDVTNVTVTATSSATNIATVAITGTATNRTLTLSSSTNAFGTSTIVLVANDGAKSATNSFVLTVTAVNDVPSFTLSTNSVTVAEDGGAYTASGLAIAISAGPSNESSQTNGFILTVTNTAFFAVQPAISPTGTLSFRPATNVFGTNTISVVIRDGGGTTNGGVNTSAAQTFDIAVTAVNDAPVISGISAFAINEDLATTNRPFVLNDVDTDVSTITVAATSSDTNLVTVSTIGTTTNRTVAVTTVTNAFGSATITLVADDGSSTATNSFVLTVNPVNDAPGFTLTTNNVRVTIYSTTVVVTNFVTNIVTGPSNESTQTWSFIVTAGNTNSFVVQPTIATNGTLTFRAKDIAGAATVTVHLQDNGGTSNGGTNTSPAQTFTVTVPPNPYIPLNGQYNGLFYETNGVLNSSAGFMNLSLTTNGTYNGYVLLAGASNSFSGQFNIAGNSTATVTRTNTDLTMTLAIDLSTNFTESITGTISDGSWTSVLQADHATFSTFMNPAPYAGEYNLALPGSSTPATLPGGAGIGTVSLAANGLVTFSGELGDGTAVNQSVSISKDGVWPLYVPLYGGDGLLLSWVTFEMGATNDLAGDATWIKKSGVGGPYYSGGFTNDLTITGSYYTEPPLGWTILDLSSASVIITGGNLSSAITNSVTLNFDSTVTVDPMATNGLAFTFNLTDGTFSGEFVNPSTSATNQFNGVVLQTSTNAIGYFLGTSQSGSVILK